VTTHEDLRYEVSDQIAEITLARPPVNALSLSLLEQLIASLRRAAADDNARAVVLTSAVAHQFSAGLDLRLMLGKPAPEVRRLLDKLYVELTEAQYNLGKPSIAAVGGSARGGGMTLAISCDVLLAGASATFGYPEIDLGLVPAIHFVHLPRIVGRHRALSSCSADAPLAPKKPLPSAWSARLCRTRRCATKRAQWPACL
jgi:enoyl-CoA hydratase/carnithine racemase